MRIQSRNSRQYSINSLNRSRNRQQPKKSSRVLFIAIVLIILIGTFFFYGKNFTPSTIANPINNIIPTREPIVENIDLSYEPGDNETINTDPNYTFIDTDIVERTKYTFKENTLSFNFTKDDIGKNYTVTLSNSEQDKKIYNINVGLKDADIEALKAEILKDLGNEKTNYGIYIKDLKRDQEVSINGQLIYPPASITKVPIAIIALRDIQAGKFTLEDTFPMKQAYKVYAFDGFSGVPNGREISLDEYITTMLRESDNTAMTALENILGGVEILDQRYKTELGIDTFFRDPHIAKAEDIGHVFEGIYKGTFLDKERNDYLLNILFHTADRFQDRIQAAVVNEPNTTVAHKIGQVTTDEGYSYNDAGIVYGPKTDFIVVVIDHYIGEAGARQTIIDTTKSAFEAFE